MHICNGQTEIRNAGDNSRAKAHSCIKGIMLPWYFLRVWATWDLESPETTAAQSAS